ncbi:Flavin containing amine oxidoreductase [Ceratobasidium sp. AG-Ba]|nr:Flavin containing amine oxidoreductase [Ceratobasidium sp. AG-Ba]QRW02421.1 Flavin containing amine oxidoreductase [Ceratobasidium sp. AG-Ba]
MDSHTSDPITSISIDIYHLCGQKLLERFHKERLHFEEPVIPPGETLPNVPSEGRAKDLPKVKTPVKNIAIVGGGVAGLYTAMLLKEKTMSSRLISTKPSIIGTPAQGGEYDYFDVGAMRFPDTPIMKKTYELFKNLKIRLLEYKISNETNWMVYNGRRFSKKQIADDPKIWSQDPFRISVTNGGTVPDKWAYQDPGEILEKELKPFIDKLAKNPNSALDELIDEFDHFSTRSYLASKGYPPALISWIETMSAGTGWFDRALIETILEEMAFKYNRKSPTDLKWRCVDGGSEIIPMKMVEWLQDNAKQTKIHMRHRVTMVDYKNQELTVSGIRHPLLTGDSSFFRKTYSHVIFAIPPPCLRMIDLDSCELDYAQRSAMRQLQLAPSIKIGMKFKTAWWGGVNQDNVGGQSTTDRTARTIVYPSHGSGKSTVLIVSYAWTSDSMILGAMMHGPGSAEEERLKQVMLGDLAYVHKENGITLEQLINEFEYMFPFDWQHNPLSMASSASSTGTLRGQPLEGRCTLLEKRSALLMGDVSRSWVAGALNSAERGVLQLLQHHKTATENAGNPQNLIDEFLREWKPDLEVKQATIFLQLIASLVYQSEEFGNK